MELSAETVAQRTFTVRNVAGIHARPAALIVQLTTKHLGPVIVESGGERGDGKSIMHLMLLAAGPGAEVCFEFGPPQESASRLLLELAHLFETKFGER